MQPVLFQNLTIQALKQIIHMRLQEVTNRLKENRGIEVNFDPSVIEYILSEWGEKDGARSVLKAINREILPAIARALVQNPCPEGSRLFVVHDGSAVRVSQPVINNHKQLEINNEKTQVS
jgi:ATP-dependent Clp protease ATP-binding subunit ClpA